MNWDEQVALVTGASSGIGLEMARQLADAGAQVFASARREQRLAQLNTGDFLFDKPGFFEVVLMPQIYNARRFGYDFAQAPHTTRIEAACLALDEVQRAHPDNQNDTPEGETVQ